MINFPVNPTATPSTLRDNLASRESASSSQSSLDLKARNTQVIEQQSQEQTGIAGLVQLNLSTEQALAQALQIKSLLLEQIFSIANEEPQDIAALLS